MKLVTCNTPELCMQVLVLSGKHTQAQLRTGACNTCIYMYNYILLPELNLKVERVAKTNKLLLWPLDCKSIDIHEL